MMNPRTRIYGTPKLEAQLLRTLRLCQRNNSTAIPEDATLSSMVCKWSEQSASIVGHLGKHSVVRKPFNCIMGCNIWIGDYVFVGSESVHMSSFSADILLRILPVSYVRT